MAKKKKKVIRKQKTGEQLPVENKLKAAIDVPQETLENGISAGLPVKARRRKRKREVTTPKKSEAISATSEIVLESSKSAEFVDKGLTGLPQLESWVRSSKGLESVEVRNDNTLGRLGAFVLRDMPVGSIAFRVGSERILTPEIAVEDSVVKGIREMLPSENRKDNDLFLCLRICRARACRDDPFHSYVCNLPAEGLGVSFWPEVFQAMIASTSLAQVLSAADAELDRWVELLRQVGKTESFDRKSLAWARGVMLSHRCKDFPNGMVPILGLLSPLSSTNASLRIRDGGMECVCEKPIKSKDQITSTVGMSNSELLVSHGFAFEDNPEDCVLLPVTYVDAKRNAEVKTTVRLTKKGVAEDVIDQIEEEQNTPFFIALLQGVIRHRREVKACLAQLPKTLNFNVCKGIVNRSRKKALESFLEAQHRILEICVEEMHTCQDDDAKDRAAGEEQSDDMEEEEEDVEEADPPEETRSWKRQRRK